jgi:hypothetical protein
MIRSDLEPPFKDDFYAEGNGPNKGAGILMPERDVINPEIQLVDQYGNVFDLVYACSRRTFSPVYNLPIQTNGRETETTQLYESVQRDPSSARQSIGIASQTKT